ncbi:hypothetical protein DIE14_32975 [Burkholderia sp. Bp9017]|nr:hypothetical protein DIE14_32975 [Burkholderia sp. Bp9017]
MRRHRGDAIAVLPAIVLALPGRARPIDLCADDIADARAFAHFECTCASRCRCPTRRSGMPRIDPSVTRHARIDVA